MRIAMPLLVAFAISTPVSADWLLTLDGTQIETTGPWRVQRSVVLFTLPSGTLSSLRVSEVDLTASLELTKAASAPTPAEEAPAAKPKSVLVIDHRKIRQATVPKEDPTAESSEPTNEAGVTSPSDEPGPVEVVFWQENVRPDLTGIEISGTLQNFSPQIATGLVVNVTLVDASRRPLKTAKAFIDSTSLAAQATTTFRALFGDATGLEGEPLFKVASRTLEFPSSNPTDDGGP